jgi:hypothetical protein
MIHTIDIFAGQKTMSDINDLHDSGESAAETLEKRPKQSFKYFIEKRIWLPGASGAPGEPSRVKNVSKFFPRLLYFYHSDKSCSFGDSTRNECYTIDSCHFAAIARYARSDQIASAKPV